MTQSPRPNGSFRISIQSVPPASLAASVNGTKISLVTRNLPFAFGRNDPDASDHQVSGDGVLLIDRLPYHVSRRHCVIECDEQGRLQLRDCGSTLGTQVDGVLLSRRRAVFVAPLPAGEHFVRLGGPRSPHHFRVVVSRLRAKK